MIELIVVLLTFFFFFFNATATTEIYTLSLHDALPISAARRLGRDVTRHEPARGTREAPIGEQRHRVAKPLADERSEEHTSELQSLAYLVCRLLLEKKKKITNTRKYKITLIHIGSDNST